MYTVSSWHAGKMAFTQSCAMLDQPPTNTGRKLFGVCLHKCRLHIHCPAVAWPVCWPLWSTIPARGLASPQRTVAGLTDPLWSFQVHVIHWPWNNFHLMLASVKDNGPTLSWYWSCLLDYLCPRHSFDNAVIINTLYIMAPHCKLVVIQAALCHRYKSCMLRTCLAPPNNTEGWSNMIKLAVKHTLTASFSCKVTTIFSCE